MLLVNCSIECLLNVRVCVCLPSLMCGRGSVPYNLLLCAHYHNVFYLPADLCGPSVRNHLRRSTAAAPSTPASIPANIIMPIAHSFGISSFQVTHSSVD